jgi:tRNA G10  N-methylase Trm11
MKRAEFEKLDKRYLVPGKGLLYAISPRLARHFAQRFQGKTVLECCTGAGFLTIELAKVARHVFTVDIDEPSLRAAQHNVSVADVEGNVTFIQGDVLHPQTLSTILKVDAAILDPVWGKTPQDMTPPADRLVTIIRGFTPNIALILPPYTDQRSIDSFFPDEVEKLYLDGAPALICLYMGALSKQVTSEFRC